MRVLYFSGQDSFVVVACSTFAALADSPSDTVTIPLKDIWALEMRGSGTRCS